MIRYEYVFALSSTNLNAWLDSGSGSPDLAATYISLPNFAYILLVFYLLGLFSLILFHLRPIMSSHFHTQ